MKNFPKFRSPRNFFTKHPGGQMMSKKKFPKSARDKYLPPLEEVSEFQDPLTLEHEKRQLMDEIDQLKKEVKPLHDQINEIQQQYFGINNVEIQPGMAEIFQTSNNLSAQLAALHTSADQLAIELAKVRAAYSEKTQNKLNSDILYQRTVLAQLQIECKQIQVQYNMNSNEYAQLMDSDSTLLIQNQSQQISALKNGLAELQKQESEMIQRYMDLVNDYPQVSQNEQILSQKKRQLISAEHRKVRFSVELRKLRKEYDDKVRYLEDMISDRENQIHIKNRRDNWKKTLAEPQKTPRNEENANGNQYEDEIVYNEEEPANHGIDVSPGDTFLVDTMQNLTKSLVIPNN